MSKAEYLIEILSAIVPIFLIVAVGFLVTRAGVLKREDMTVLATYVVKVALPALIFVNVAGRSLEDVLNPTYLLTYAIAAMAMVGLARLWGRARRSRPARTATLAFAVSGTNNGFVAFPMFLLLLPDVAGLAIGMDMLVDNVLIIPVALTVFEALSGQGTHWGRRLAGTGARVVTHPMVIAIILALSFGAIGFTPPTMLDNAVTLVANSSSAVALFSIGGMLVGLHLRGQRTDLAAALTAKLLIMPVATVGIVLLLPVLGLPELSPELRAAAILTGAMPSASSVSALAEQHGEGEFGAAATLLSTAVSFLTLTGWMLGLRAIGWL